MKKQLQILILLLLSSLAYPQVWTPPVNISNLSGYCMDPNMVIDHNGVIHAVWSYRIDNDNYWKIMYSKSEDDGLTWSAPYDVLQNTSLWMSQPHIACDNSGRFLYVTYDYNTMDPANMLVYMVICDRGQWGIPIQICNNMLGSYYNNVIVDNDNKVYAFWSNHNLKTFYRYLENDEWSDIKQPYYNNLPDFYALYNCRVDSANTLKWAGYSTQGMSTGYYNQAYFEFNPATNQWSIPYIFTGRKASIGNAIDLDKNGNPQIAFREITNDSTPPNTGTFYTSGINQQWSKPELVIENDPECQQIAIDQNDQPNIVDMEENGNGFKLVHYQKINNKWVSTTIDTAGNILYGGKLLFYKNCLYLTYFKSQIPGEMHSDVVLTKYDVITGLEQLKKEDINLTIFPNPFETETNVAFSLNQKTSINLSVYDLNGRQIITLINEDKTPGRYQTLWNGRDQNGKEVNSGLYLVHLQWGRNTVTRPVEYSKQ